MKKKKNIFKKIFFSGLFIPLVILVIIIFGSALFGKYNENKAINGDLEKLKKEIEDLEKNNQDLDRLLEYFNSNFFIEKEAREKLGLKKEGEKVAVVSDDRNYTDQGGSAYPLKSAVDSHGAEKFLPKKWWNYFFGEE